MIEQVNTLIAMPLRTPGLWMLQRSREIFSEKNRLL